MKSVVARVLGVHNDERAWRIGADGEEAVAARLVRLGDAWKVLHAVPIGDRGSDIDHVVIGPGGVYTVNTKHLPDSSVWVGGNTLMVNGQKRPYIRNSRLEATRAAMLMSEAVGSPVFVTALIVLVGAHEGVTIKSQPPGGGVFVVTRKEIAAWLERPGRVLNTAQVDTIFAQARKSTTWSDQYPRPGGAE